MTEETPALATPSHNHEQPVVWECCQNKRTFVRTLEETWTYSHLTKEILSQPRVISVRDKPWKGGPQQYSNTAITPGSTKIAQSIESPIEAVLLVFKAKPLFLFMHLLFQKMICYPLATLLEGHESWKPPADF